MEIKMKIAICGYGYWGPNLCRNFQKYADLEYIIDSDESKKSLIKEKYPSVKYRKSLDSVLDKVDAVVIATPPHTHCELAKQALENGLHVFVEKPMTLSEKDARFLTNLATLSKLKLMVDHTFLYAPEIIKIKELLPDIGDIVYIHATRVNLGKFQSSNIVWDLAPHDFSIFNYLIEDVPVKVRAFGKDIVHKDIVDIAYVNVEYSKGALATIHMSWLHPFKGRETVIVGTEKMIVYDMLAEEKIKVYDKGVNINKNANKGFGEYLLSYRHGDVWSPFVEVCEPLDIACKHFVECITNDTQPLTDGYNGTAVVELLEAAQLSLSRGGEVVELEEKFIL